MEDYFGQFPFIKKRDDASIVSRGSISIMNRCLSANGTYIDAVKCVEGNDNGTQYFELLKNGQLVHNVGADLCLEALPPFVKLVWVWLQLYF